jgi:phospholipid-binding lipoprotein MlaA
MINVDMSASKRNDRLRPRLKAFLGIGLCAMLTGCATQPKNPEDPYETYNRQMFAFNQELYTLAHPILAGYRTVTPGPVQAGIRNFKNNVWMVPTIGNDLLQANFRWAGEDTLRFLLNTTLGCFGLFDVASHVGLYQRDQSFGLTLARWGAVQSPYLILPVFGPTTGRGMLGTVPDNFMLPMTYTSGPAYWTYQGLTQTQMASDHLPQFESITQTAIDPYVAVRTAYLQNQALLVWQVRHENLPLSDAPMLQSMDALGQMESPEQLASNGATPS